MKLKVLSFSWETFFSETVVSVKLKTKVWQVTVLNNHAPMMASLQPSVLYVKYMDKNNMMQEEDFAVWTGVMEIDGKNDVKIIADILIDIEEVDKEKAENARQRALDIMEKYKQGKDRVDMQKFIDAEDMLLKSIAQLKLADLKK